MGITLMLSMNFLWMFEFHAGPALGGAGAKWEQLVQLA